MIYRKIFYNYKTIPLKFVKLSNIPVIFQRMIIYIEDGNFYKHNGIDFESLKVAYKTNKKFNKIISGASTITMQLARTLFLTPDRNYIRKYLEIIAALEIELIMPKKRILELYLNYIEFGKGLYGVQTASYYYYKKPINKLNYYHMAQLVTILASPIKYDVNTALRSKKLRQRFYFLNEKFQIINE
ncbi:MAG: biosynthetic peptidoglycan transglycosylase [Exilispira sp.]